MSVPNNQTFLQRYRKPMFRILVLAFAIFLFARSTPPRDKIIIPRQTYVESEFAIPWPADAGAPMAMATDAVKELQEPFRKQALDGLKSNQLTITLKPHVHMTIDANAFKAWGASDEQIAAIEKADKFCVLKTVAEPVWPPIKEIYNRQLAAVLARKLKTVTWEVLGDRVRSYDQAMQYMDNKTDREAFSHWTPIITTPMKDGLWMTSCGLNRVGMPELEVKKVPPQLEREMSALMSGLAWAVAKRAIASGDTVTLPNKMQVSAEDITEAYGYKVSGKKTSVDLMLREREGNPGIEFLILTPPLDPKHTEGEYFHAKISELFGGPTDEVIKGPKSEAMNKAIATARASLSTARKKYLADPLQKQGTILVKFKITDGKNNEYLWGYVTEWSKPEKLTLSCSSTADMSDYYQPGKIIHIDEAIITDWAVQQSNGEITEGNWTTKVLQKEK